MTNEELKEELEKYGIEFIDNKDRNIDKGEVMIVKIGYCKICGNENLRKVSSEQVYCHNCNEYTRKEKLGYRDMSNTERVVYEPNCS